MKLLAIALLLTTAFGAYAHSHYYSKVSEYAGENGQVVCQWKCGYGNAAHYRTTSGYGSCPHAY